MSERRSEREERHPRASGHGDHEGIEWLLRVLLGGSLELEIGKARFRLSQDRVFRLEEVDGGFVYYLRDAGALRRRLVALRRRERGAGCAATRAGTDPLSSN